MNDQVKTAVLEDIAKQLKALVNLQRFVLQEKYIEAMRGEKGIIKEDIPLRADSYAQTLKEVAYKD